MQNYTFQARLSISILLLALNACQVNNPPVIQGLTSNQILDSDPVSFNLSAIAQDEDGDSLTYVWSCEAGVFPEGTNMPTVKWRPPFNFNAAKYDLIVSVSDNEFKVTDTMEVALKGSPHLKDPRDGKLYGVVKLGSQTWMKENLNYEVDYYSRCYRDDSEMCKKYGHLYEWITARSACPPGWHLPSMDEWLTLLEWAGPEAGLMLKSRTGWYENGNGRDTLGFNILPAGRWYANEYYGHLGMHSSFWTSDEENQTSAKYIRFDYYGSGGYQYSSDQGNYFSVRCIQSR